jgi:hypothetical protein
LQEVFHNDSYVISDPNFKTVHRDVDTDKQIEAD